ncbi:hypothetical protein Q7390_05060, partial [Glaesserella parasuis]|nr:hypothetical protein [Glaesserella parasuis]
PLDAVYPIVYLDCIVVSALHCAFKQVYQAPTEAQARENLTALSQKWQAKYPLVKMHQKNGQCRFRTGNWR